MSDLEESAHVERAVRQLPAGHVLTTRTVYDDIAGLLLDHGWVQGVQRRRGALSLRAAVDEAVGIRSGAQRAPSGRLLARAGHIGSHLRDLAGARSLDAWSDDRRRTLAEVLDLLRCASVGFADD